MATSRPNPYDSLPYPRTPSSADARKPSRFIVIEGLDGAGTTTQVRRLVDRMRISGLRAEETREPTLGPLGAVIRQAIEKRIEMEPRALALAFAADRLDHYFNPVTGIAKLLDEGVHVITDRYVVSSLAYQSLDADLDWLQTINTQAPPPDRTFFLRTPAQEAWRRVQLRSHAPELFHDLARLERVAELYERAIALYQQTNPVTIIDGTETPEAIAEKIWKETATLTGASA